MKALVLEEYMQLVYKDVPEPVLQEDEVLIRVKAAGICGSDVHGLDGSTGRRIPPLIMGHEASGTVEKTGSNVYFWKEGDRVTFDSTIYKKNDWYTQQGMYNLSDDRMVIGVSTPDFRRNGAFAEYVAVPQHIIYPIPDNVSFTEAALTEPAAVALHAINLSGFSETDTVLVMGAGIIGTFIIRLLSLKGCRNIIAVDPELTRLETAWQAGANYKFQPGDPDLLTTIHQLSGNRGADISFEAVGITDTIRNTITLTRKGGTVILVGNISPEVQLPLQQVVKNS
jgi:L-iditol 2-dehydrogenase